MIEVSKLNFSYQKQKVLEDINFKVQHNELLTIIGLNGRGKSTLLKLILGIYELKEGSIKIFEKDIQNKFIKLVMFPKIQM